jgi:hypothetical protein
MLIRIPPTLVYYYYLEDRDSREPSRQQGAVETQSEMIPE